MTVAAFLHGATRQLEAASIATARLDVQVLLERALHQNKAWLLAHGEEHIEPETLAALQKQVQSRCSRNPLAYITGRQEFYGRNFSVSPQVLIPRPATEQLIEHISQLNLPDNATVLDVGTGSGAIAVTIALELPHTRVEACDISTEALAIAETNAQRLQAQVYFFVSNLLQKAEHQYDAVIANLPYVGDSWERSPETNFEPKTALFAADNGLELIKKLIKQAPDYLHSQGYLVLEADPRQFAAIKRAAKPMFELVAGKGYSLVFRKRS